VWVTNADDDTMSRLDARSNEVTATRDVGDQPTGVVVANGALWVSLFEIDTLERYEPAG
jgi:YVTN family beta-propeller protein